MPGQRATLSKDHFQVCPGYFSDGQLLSAFRGECEIGPQLFQNRKAWKLDERRPVPPSAVRPRCARPVAGQKVPLKRPSK